MRAYGVRPLLVLLATTTAPRNTVAQCSASPCQFMGEPSGTCTDVSATSHTCECVVPFYGNNCELVEVVPPVCVCPTGQPTCTVADLQPNDEGAWGSPSCSINDDGHLDAEIRILNNADITTLDLTGLVSVWRIRVQGNTNLRSLELPTLVSVTFDIKLYACSGGDEWDSWEDQSDSYCSSELARISLPALTVAESIEISNGGHWPDGGDETYYPDNLLSLDLSSLHTLSISLSIQHCQALTTLTLPNLRTIGSPKTRYGHSAVDIDDVPAAATIDLRALESVWGSFSLSAWNWLPQTAPDAHHLPNLVPGTTTIHLEALRHVEGGFEFTGHKELETLDLPSLHTVEGIGGGLLIIQDCEKLVTVNLPRLRNVGMKVQISNNHADTKTVLPCKAQKIPKLRVQGVRYFNAYSTMCHHGSTQVAANCAECEEYGRLRACGDGSSCVQCDPRIVPLRAEVLDSLCATEQTLCRGTTCSGKLDTLLGATSQAGLAEAGDPPPCECVTNMMCDVMGGIEYCEDVGCIDVDGCYSASELFDGLLRCYDENYFNYASTLAGNTMPDWAVPDAHHTESPPVLKPGYVRFSPEGQSTHSTTHIYPCETVDAPWTCRPSRSCFCPFGQAVCNVATDLLDSDGNAMSPVCTPDAQGVLAADLYIYGNYDVRTVDFGDIETVDGSIIVEDSMMCPWDMDGMCLSKQGAPRYVHRTGEFDGIWGWWRGGLRVSSGVPDDWEEDTQIIAESLTFVNGSIVIHSELLDELRAPKLETIGGRLSVATEEMTALGLFALSSVSKRIALELHGKFASSVRLPELSSVGGEAYISVGPLVESIDLSNLENVVGDFYVVDSQGRDVEVALPCSAQTKPWESMVDGTVRFKPSVLIECHTGPNTPWTQAVREVCDVCDACVSCNTQRNPIVQPDYVRAVSLGLPDKVVHVFECQGNSCHGNNDTEVPVASCLLAYEGHLCQSCASGYHMDKSLDECVKCNDADILISIGVLAIGAILFCAGGVALRRKKREMSGATEAEIQALLAVLRSVWVPIRIMITYSQISQQFGTILDVQFAEGFVFLMERTAAIFNVVDIIVSSECVGLGRFFFSWLKEIVMKPGLLLFFVFIYYLRERKKSEHAWQTFIANTFFVCFFCYPAICSKAFATFICTTLLEDDLSGNDVAFSVLVADDRVRCEATSHRALEVATFAVIVLFAFGVPIGAAVFLRNALGKQPEPDKRLQYRVASDFNLDLQAASDLIQDIRASSKYGFLVGAYRPSVYFWESIDMLRKLWLCGLVLVFQRGSILQLMAALLVACTFALAQSTVSPYKLLADNVLRLSTECHNIITIGIAILLKTDTADDMPSRKKSYDLIMLGSFGVLVAIPFFVTIVAKLVSIRQLMRENLQGVDIFSRGFGYLERITGLDLDRDGSVGNVSDNSSASKAGGVTQDDQDQIDLKMVVKRFELGLQSDRDREVMLAYFDEPSPGMSLWKEKLAVGHLTSEQMQQTIVHLQAELPKSDTTGLHFTDLDSASLILNSIGIRASTVGQLSGGVSICLASMNDLSWTKGGGEQFEKAVGAALWGSKAYEVMSGTPPPGAHENYGKYSKKLECVFVVRIPSAKNQDPRRVLPGRKHVYILPRSACIEDDGHHWYPNANILSCFVLKQPDDKASCAAIDAMAKQQSTIDPTRMLCRSSRDDNGGMCNTEFDETDTDVKDDIDSSSGFPPLVHGCMVTVASYPADETELMIQRHRSIESKKKGCQHWQEDVERFTEMEMEAALYSMDQALLQTYMLAYHYTSVSACEAICAKGGGIRVGDASGRGIVICVQSPVALGWQAHAGGDFQARLQQLWCGEQQEAAEVIEVMVVLSVPTAMLCDANRCPNSAAGLWCIPSELLVDDGERQIYSNAHVQKCYAVINDANRIAAVAQVSREPATNQSQVATPPPEAETPTRPLPSTPVTVSPTTPGRMTKSQLRALVSQHASPERESSTESMTTPRPPEAAAAAP